MLRRSVHIVCLDAPSPPDYGGVYDLYYKVPALAAAGFDIILHYFSYKEGRSASALEPFCKKIYTYSRKGFAHKFFSGIPFIVRSRIATELIKRLNDDNYPVILEGIHCTGIIQYQDRKNRKIIVRIHNDEALYYQALSQTEKNIFHKAYLVWEAKLLALYQKQLPKDVHYSFVSQTDEQLFKEKYNVPSTNFIPVFIPWKEINGKTGRGAYCLYQGNLSVAENEEAALWLLRNVFTSLDVPLIIAGKNPGQGLIAACGKCKNVSLIANPTESKLTELIQNAHIHLLPSLNKTGVKLKLLHALFEGRFCITNWQGIAGSNIEQGVLVAESSEEYSKLILHYMESDFTQLHVEERKYIPDLYNNDLGAQAFSAFL